MPVDLQQLEKLDAYALKVSLAFASVLLPVPLQQHSMNLAQHQHQLGLSYGAMALETSKQVKKPFFFKH